MNWTELGRAQRLWGSSLAFLLALMAVAPARAEDESGEASTDDREATSENEPADSAEGAPEDSAEDDDDAAPPKPSSVHRHDGLYLRLAAGGAYFSDAVESEPLTNYAGGVARGTLAGTGWAGHIAAGYTIAEGLVLGGSFIVHYIPSVDTDNAVIAPTPLGEFRPIVTFENTTLSLIGPFLDYYPSPTFGLHFEACIGFGVLSMSNGMATVAGTTQGLGDQAGSGVAAMVGVGFDIWIASELSLGILAEVMGGLGAGDDGSGTHWNHTVFTPALLLAATYN